MTETDEPAAALDAAACRWPHLSRGQLVARLAVEGHRALGQAESDRRARREAAVESASGALTGAYEKGYLAKLREDWPR